MAMQQAGGSAKSSYSNFYVLDEHGLISKSRCVLTLRPPLLLCTSTSLYLSVCLSVSVPSPPHLGPARAHLEVTVSNFTYAPFPQACISTPSQTTARPHHPFPLSGPARAHLQVKVRKPQLSTPILPLRPPSWDHIYFTLRKLAYLQHTPAIR